MPGEYVSVPGPDGILGIPEDQDESMDRNHSHYTLTTKDSDVYRV